jgi:hypothetical protein
MLSQVSVEHNNNFWVNCVKSQDCRRTLAGEARTKAGNDTYLLLLKKNTTIAKKNSVNNGTVRAVLTSKAKRTILCVIDQNLCYGTLRAIGKVSVKNAKHFDKKWRFSLILRYFLNDKRSVAGRYCALKNSDKFALPTLL